MRRILEYLCALVLGALVLTPFVQVIMRGVFNAAIIGAEELTRVLLIAAVFIAYPLVAENGENIAMTEIRDYFSSRITRILQLFAMAAGVGITITMVIVIFQNISANMLNATPTLKIPFWLFLGLAGFGFAGAALAHLRRFASKLREPAKTEER